MDARAPTSRAFTLGAVREASRRNDGGELAALLRLDEAGVEIARLVAVPEAEEERFYRLNNLPDRLLDLFADVDPADPDEDDLEELAPRARRMIERHFMLEEVVDAFYEAIAALPPRVRVRRPGQAGREVARGRPALLELKRIWAGAWGFDALVVRLRRSSTFALEARPVLVHAADEPADPGLAARARAVLGSDRDLWQAPGGGVTRVAPLSAAGRPDAAGGS